MARTSDQCPRGTHGYRAGWVYRSIEELNAKHSPQDAGISLERREEKRIAYTVLLHDAGQAMQIPQTVIASADFLCHRFFAIRSMSSNDVLVVATACLFTAAKISDYPKALRDVCQHMWQCRYRGKIAIFNQVKDREWQDAFRAAVLKAERAMLYVIGFDLGVPLPYKETLDIVHSLKLHTAHPELPQTAWNLVMASLQTTLGLQYPSHLIAAGAIYTALKLHQVTLAPLPGDYRQWYQRSPIDADAAKLEDITMQLLDALGKLRSTTMKRALPAKYAAMLNLGNNVAAAAADMTIDSADLSETPRRSNCH